MRLAAATALVVAAVLVAQVDAAKYVVKIVADDLGYNDLSYFNGGKTSTPNIDQLIREGILLSQYYTFKICSPTRASIMTGRYPWGAGFYDMAKDEDHTTTNFTLFPEVLLNNGADTHALGKWDVGFVNKASTATHRGFKSFLGYYQACVQDYWYHWAALTEKGAEYVGIDLSKNNGSQIGGAANASYFGVYDRNIFSDEAVSIIASHDTSKPLFIYCAFQNVHLGCGNGRNLGINAPCASVDKFAHIANDTYKGQAGMLLELDYGVGDIVAALKAAGIYQDTIITFVSDNGGPLDHSTNAPFRGGKHTFWEGGVRVVSFVSGGAIPAAQQGTVWAGMAHSSDWYRTIVEGIMGFEVPANTGPRPLDGYNLWDAITKNTTSPRNVVIHQVENEYFTEGVTAIRVGAFKLITGPPGDNRVVPWPDNAPSAVPFGRTGGEREAGTDHCRAAPGHTAPGTDKCKPHCLFNVEEDESESRDLAGDPKYASLIANITRILETAAKTGPPPAYVYPTGQWPSKVQALLSNMAAGGFLEPLDLE